MGGTITLVLPKSSSKDDIQALREQYKGCCKLNLIISGEEPPEETFKNLIMAKINS